MPIYEFECKKGHLTEKIVKMGTEGIKCPKCKLVAKKIISNCGFKLKGTGWYETDYKKKEKPPKSAEESAKEKNSESKENEI